MWPQKAVWLLTAVVVTDLSTSPKYCMYYYKCNITYIFLPLVGGQLAGPFLKITINIIIKPVNLT